MAATKAGPRNVIVPRTPPRRRISLTVGDDGSVAVMLYSSSSTSPWTSRVRGVPSAQGRSATRTHSGPPNGSCRSTVTTTPGRTPSSPRWRSAALSRSDTRRTRKHAPGGTASRLTPHRSSCAPCRGGIGSPCGSWVGWPSAASMRSSSRSDSDVLQQLGLGVHLVPRHVEYPGEERLQQSVPPHDAQRRALARAGEPQLPGARPVDELALLQALDHGRHGGRRDPQLGREQPGGDRLPAVGDVVDRLEVVLTRAGQADHDRNVGASTEVREGPSQSETRSANRHRSAPAASCGPRPKPPARGRCRRLRAP